MGPCGGYLESSDAGEGQKRLYYQHLQPASLYQPRVGPRFIDEEEYRFFHLFRSDTIPLLAGSFNDTLWGSIITQASETEPFVLDCVIAIGALSMAAILLESYPRTASTKNRDKNRTYEYALRQYGKALKAMRIALSSRQQNLRQALIACLLVFCFESYIGNQVAAITHAQSGITLLHQWKSNTKASSTDIQSPNPHIIEDELVQAFTRLDLQVIPLDSRPLKFHQTIKMDCFTALQKMPRVFKTLDEARIWCEQLLRWNYHFRAESAVVGKSQEIDMKGLPMAWQGSMDPLMGTTMLHDPKEVPVALLPEYRAHTSKMTQWFDAFIPLFSSLQMEPGRDMIGGTVLLIQAKMSLICLASAFFTLETSYDYYLPEFSEIVALANSIAVKFSEKSAVGSNARLVYHFDSGFIPPLFLVATKCRDRALRRKAIALLYSSPLREGVFDSICCGKMADWIVAVEEEGIEEGDIPDHRRLRIRRSNISLPKRRVQLQVTQYRTVEDTEPEWKETVLTW